MKTILLSVVVFLGICLITSFLHATPPFFFIQVVPGRTYRSTLYSPSSAVYFKMNMTEIGMTPSAALFEYLPRIQSCTGRVNVYGLVCVPGLYNSTECIDDEYVPSVVNNDFQFVEDFTHVDSTGGGGQKELTDFGMCDGPLGLCNATHSGGAIFYIMIQPAKTYNQVTLQFRVDEQRREDVLVDYAETRVRYDNFTDYIRWDDLAICNTRDAITGQCTDRSLVNGVTYKIYYQRQYGDRSALDSNLATECGIAGPGVISHHSTTPEFKFPREYTGTYMVNVVAEYVRGRDRSSSSVRVVYDSALAHYTSKSKNPLRRSAAGLIAGLVILLVLSLCVTIAILVVGVYSIYYDRRYGYTNMSTVENPPQSSDHTSSTTTTSIQAN